MDSVSVSKMVMNILASTVPQNQPEWSLYVPLVILGLIGLSALYILRRTQKSPTGKEADETCPVGATHCLQEGSMGEIRDGLDELKEEVKELRKENDSLSLEVAQLNGKLDQISQLLQLLLSKSMPQAK